jgi:anaerobic magnesium-protoporphyrin IX monomethyl ester cyclase
MSKNILLIYPRHITGWAANEKVMIPLGLLCLATPLSAEGYDVQIIDQRIEPRWRSILMYELEQDPICIGISSMTGPQLQHALEVSEIVKEYCDAPVVWGGAHASLLPEQTLKARCIDIVVQGEGEETFRELVYALEGKMDLQTVKGIWYKEYGRIKHTGKRPFLDLNQQPPLAYHLIDTRRYVRVIAGAEHLNFVTSRGCPHSCAFCVNTPLNRRRFRSMDPDLVVQRIKDLVKTYGIGGVTISDMNFFTDMDRGRKILKGFISEDLNILISKISVRVDTLFGMSQDDFRLLERAGCRRITVGVESGSERIQALLKKKFNIQGLLKINRALSQYAITPSYLFMTGIPDETMEDLSQSVGLALKLVDQNPNTVIQFSIFTPFPRTELFGRAVKNGLPIPQQIEEWIPYNYRNFSENEIWVEKRMLKTIEMIDFCSLFLGKKTFFERFERKDRLFILLFNLYAPLARKRMEGLLYQFPIEIKISKLLGIYGKQA